MSIPSSFIDRLLSTVSIVDIINRRVQLDRSGGRYKAKCPFHGDGNEKTPSFVIYEEKVSYMSLGLLNGKSLKFTLIV